MYREIVLFGVSIWIKLIQHHKFLEPSEKSTFSVAKSLWSYVTPSRHSTSNHEIAALMLLLAEINYQCTQTAMCESLQQLQNDKNVVQETVAECYQRFVTLYHIMAEYDTQLKYYWRQSVYVMLAACEDSRVMIKNVAVSWLTESVSRNPQRVIDPMIYELLDLSTVSIAVKYKNVVDALFAINASHREISNA